MRNDFSDAEEWSRKFDAPERVVWQKPDHVIELMEIPEGGTAVDIGAGTGYFMPYLSRAVGEGGRVLALDIAESLVDFMNERAEKEGLANAEARLIRTDDPGLDDGSVDRVLVVNTWHHIPEREAYARKLAKALRPGGRVFIVDFTMETEKGPDAHHKLAPQKMVETFAAAGLDARILEEDLPDQYVVEARPGEGP